MESNINSNRTTLFKTAQELLLLIAQLFPLVLTHPGTLDALHQQLTFSEDAEIISNTLQILATIKDQSIIHNNKKTAK